MNWHHWYWWTWPAGIAIGVTLVCAFNWTANEISMRRAEARTTAIWEAQKETRRPS